MIRVNLLSGSPGAAQPRSLFPSEQRPAAVGLAMLLVTALGVGGWWYYLNVQHANTEESIITAETRIEELKDALKLLEAARLQKAELEERLALIARLQTAKLAPVKLLDVLNEKVPDGLWLMEIKQVQASVQIEGRSLSHTAVTDFAESLQKSGFFKMPVEIITTLMETVEETTVIRFVLKAEPVMGVGLPVAPASPAVAGRPGAESRRKALTNCRSAPR
jgi:Tfp pilus assembly protein PilN